MNTAKLLKNHYFAAEQQPLLSSPEKASRVSRTTFIFYLVEIYGAQLTKGSVLFLCDPLTSSYTSLIYDTLFNPLSETLFEFFNVVWSEIQPLDRQGVFRKTSFESLERLVSTLNTNALQSRKESLNKIARQEIEGFTRLLDVYTTSVRDADLNEEEISDSLTLLSWYFHRF